MKEDDIQAGLGSYAAELQGQLPGLRQCLQRVRAQDDADPFHPVPGGAVEFSEAGADQWQPVLLVDRSRSVQRAWRTARAQSIQSIARLVDDRYLPGLKAAVLNRLAWLDLFLKTWERPLDNFQKNITG